MSHKEKLNFKVKKGKNKRLGFQVSRIDGDDCHLRVSEVENDSSAQELGLKVDDIIIKINTKELKTSKKNWISEINESKCSSVTLQIERERIKKPTISFTNNLSKTISSSNLSDTNNTNSITHSETTESFSQLSNSRDNGNSISHQHIESTNYSPLQRYRVLTNDSTFIPESSLDDFIEPADITSPPIANFNDPPYNFQRKLASNQNDGSQSLINAANSIINEKFRDYEDSKPMVKRKPAYSTDPRKIRGSMDQINTSYFQQQYQPKITKKNATKLYSAQAAKEIRLNITHKRRTNTSGALPAFDSFTKPSYANNSGSSHTNNDGMTKSSSMSPKGFKEFTKSDDTAIQTNNATSSTKEPRQKISNSEANLTRSSLSQPICVNIKIFSFYEPVKKGMLKLYTLEKENIGVMFTCNEINHKEMPQGSLVLDHRITNPRAYFSSWPQSNCPSKFLLPLSNSSYGEDVIMSSANGVIRVDYVTHKVEFMIKIDDIEDSVLTSLYEMLQLENPVAQSPQSVTQPTSYLVNSDNTSKRKIISDKKWKPPKPLSDSPKLPPHLSKLVQSNKVKNVPLVFVICVEIVERLGLTVNGIYRQNGNIGDRKNLEEIVYKEIPSIWASRKEWLKIHNVTNLLKRILDKYKLLDAGTALKMAIIKPPNDSPSSLDFSDRVQSCMDMQYHLQSLTSSFFNSPEERECRLATFLYLIRHMNRVSKSSNENMMTCQNLAICLMPNLIEELPETTINSTNKGPGEDKQNPNMPLSLGNENKVILNEKMIKIMSFWIQYADFITDIMSVDQKAQETEVKQKVEQFVNNLQLSNLNAGSSSTDLLTKSVNNCNEIALSCSGKSSIDNSSGVWNDEERDSLNESKKEESSEEVDYAKVVGDIFTQYIGDGSELINLPNKTISVSGDNLPENNGDVVLNSFIKTSSINFGKNNPLTGQYISETKKYTNTSGLVRRSSSTSPKNIRKIKNQIDTKYGIGAGSVYNKYNKNEIQEMYNVLSKSVKNLPLVIEICVELVENFGMNIEGIYRKNGSGSEISELKYMIYNEDPTVWPSKFELWKHLLNTSCLLKSVIKDMGLILKEAWLGISSQFSVSTQPSSTSTEPAPNLSQTELRKTLMAAAYWLSITRLIHVTSSHMTKQNGSSNIDESLLSNTKSSSNEKLEKMAHTKWTTLKYVLKHLKKVLDNCQTNKMNMQALCVCFMPVLLEDDIDTQNLLISTKKNPIIIQVLIEHQDWILQWGDRPEKEQCDGTMSDSLDKYLMNRELDILLEKANKNKDASLNNGDNKETIDASNKTEINPICSSEEVLTLLTKIVAASDRNDSKQNIRRRYSATSSNESYLSGFITDRGIIRDYL